MLLFSEVVVGWDPSISAGEGISCNGSESKLLDCSIYNSVTEYPCIGGATIISCLSSGEQGTKPGNMVLHAYPDA